MPILCKQVTQDEVYANWMKHEYQYRQDFKNRVDRNFSNSIPIILNPDFNNQTQNQQRFEIFWSYRMPILKEIQPDTKWWIANINEYDMKAIRLINSGEWREISTGTLSPIDCAKRINDDITLRNGKHSVPVNDILDKYRILSSSSSKPIIIGPNSGPLTVIDGVHRIIAYSLFYFIRKEAEFSPKGVYLGITQLPFEVVYG
jgi:hypothetical protein